MLISLTTVWQFWVNFWAFWERYFLSKDRSNQRWKYEILKIWWIYGFRKLKMKWRIGRWIPNSPLPTVNRLVVFPTHFNPNSLLIWLQISLLFMCAPALTSIYFRTLETHTIPHLFQPLFVCAMQWPVIFSQCNLHKFKNTRK